MRKNYSMAIRFGEIRMHYTISEMSKLLGVTTHMLRYYEKIGMIRPEVNPENGYRYYSVIDTRRFNLSRQLFSAGIPLEQCVSLMTEMNQEQIEKLLDDTIRQKRIEIERIKVSLGFLECTKEYYAALGHNIGKIQVESFPRMWRLTLSNCEKPVVDSSLEKEKQEWLACQPAVFWVSRIPNSILRQMAEGEIDYEYGLMCYESDAKALGLRKTSNVEIVPGGDYLVTLHRKIERGPFVWDDIEAVTQYIRENKLSFYGDAFSYIVASRMEDGVAANYHRLFVKIYT